LRRYNVDEIDEAMLPKIKAVVIAAVGDGKVDAVGS
jgi:hypothetical protein